MPDLSRGQRIKLEYRRIRRRMRYTRAGDWWTSVGVICFALAVAAFGVAALWISDR